MTGPKGRSVLFFLTLINLFNYLDRYILVALSPAIKRDLGLSDTQVGFLTTAFMVSYFLISPLFGWLGDRKPRLKLMAFGVGIWSLATAVCGFGQNAAQLFGGRIFVGVGEAAYASISPAVLRDLFPKAICGRIFAIFFMAIPVGSALGYLLGGILEKSVGWRAAFLVAGLPGLLLALGLLFLNEPKRGAFDEGVDQDRKIPLLELAKALAQNSNYLLTVFGYCAYTFVVGGVAVWIPHYVERYLGVSAASGNMAFGAITVVAGFLGTMVGGAWADRWAARSGDGYLKLSALSMFAAFPVYLVVLATRNFGVFCVATFFLEFFLFLSTSPVNAQIVNCVSPRMRASACAIAIFAIHLLGDGFSAPLVGAISDRSSLLQGMMLFSAVIVISGAIWSWKVVAEWEPAPWPVGAFKLPRAQCHRGFHLNGAKENTLEAFRAAAHAGAEMIELDVRLSSDGIAVVIHDADAFRVSGKAGAVSALTAAELKKIAQAPSLSEVLEDGECRGMLMNVELKHLGGGRNQELVRAVVAAVHAADAGKRVLFSSFNPLMLRAISFCLPEAPRALLATRDPDPDNKIYLRRMWLAFLARPHMLNYDGRYLTASLARSLASRKVPLAVWTIDNPLEARKFLAMGAQSIISSLPRIV